MASVIFEHFNHYDLDTHQVFTKSALVNTLANHKIYQGFYLMLVLFSI